MKNILQHGTQSAEELYSRIDSLAPEEREFGKLPILRQDPTYLNFLTSATGLARADILAFLSDLDSDLSFKKTFLERANLLGSLSDAGDLRFHATTLYVLVRAQQPVVAVETGVAHGKSSAYILLALQHNGAGSLLSVDLPATGQLAPDGSRTHLSGLPAGWLVPDYLRRNWAFHSEDSLGFLKSTLPELIERQFLPHKVSFFLHDSLHTYEHVAGELSLIRPLLEPQHCIAVDNLDMAGGPAFDDYLGEHGQIAHSFTDFGATLGGHPKAVVSPARKN
jgi:hypothetical protein